MYENRRKDNSVNGEREEIKRMERGKGKKDNNAKMTQSR